LAHSVVHCGTIILLQCDCPCLRFHWTVDHCAPYKCFFTIWN